MKRTIEPIVDLGAASVETKGPVGPFRDEQAGILAPGLADD
ncbi:benenodin family lasso peptide [Sphingomonas canadensis]|uniref:Benenodin family lasso peptide n=1 Tax=Sphingomonas canadensis TaxID=1219257 RepID=A0ABW3H6Q1_9SPHN|nr:benenodin family lasso peptide [Sphingomonas canadensis]MCW3835022.1 benenodin family lasso peptide [Sphingomonas canadensis]